MKINWQIEWKTYDTFYAIDSFAHSWSENEKLIMAAADEAEHKGRPDWIPQNEDEEGEYRMECRNARHLHDEILTPMFRYSAIVMLYTTVERELRRLVANLEKEQGSQKLKVKDIRAESFLKQVNKFTETFFALSLANSAHYGAISDLQKIRDCIVHCRGEVNLVNEKDRAYLLQLKEKRSGFLAFPGTDLDLEAECVEQFIKEVWSFFTAIFQKLNWKIDDSWQNTKWALSNTASLGSSTTKN